MEVLQSVSVGIGRARPCPENSPARDVPHARLVMLFIHWLLKNPSWIKSRAQLGRDSRADLVSPSENKVASVSDKAVANVSWWSRNDMQERRQDFPSSSK